MRIAHIVCTFPPYYGGMGNVVFETAKALIARGHDVRVYTPLYGEEEFAETQEYVSRIPAAVSFGNAAYIPQLKQELEDVDIVHLHYPFFGVANMVRKWKLKHPEKKLVVTYHMDNRAQGLKGLFFKMYASIFLPKVLSAADVLIGSSHDYIAVSDAGQLYRKNKNKWQSIPFGVDSTRFSPQEKPPALFARHNLDIFQPTAIFVGGMDSAHYFKGIDVLLKALLVMKKNDRPMQAVLVGDGKLREHFELTARGYGLDTVRFVGRVSDEELPDYYHMADVCVLPSTTRGEAFGMVLLEAMASGVPVVASNLPGVRTVAEDGGFVFRPGDYEELAEILMSYLNASTQELSQEVRQIVEEKYTWGTHAELLEEVYKKLY